VAEELSLRPAEVVAIHVAVTYRVFLLGFAPGFAYLGTVSPRLALPRRATPRSQVPPGSVAIAGAQTAVYPFAMPGGWHLLGRTDVRLWDATADRPSRLVPGDRVRFVAVAN
jgi:KipI family sensor histidine kinase inhibitor